MKNLLLIAFSLLSINLWAQPTALIDGLSIRNVMNVEDNACTRIDIDPATSELYYVTVSGDIHKVDVESGRKVRVFSSADHGLREVYGFDIGTSGNMYLVSMDPDAGENIAIIKKYDGDSWTTMVTATYPRSSRDHRFNAVIETPDQQHILVNSGARTDHGELKGNNQRENAFTAKLLKFPVTTENLILEDDEAFMSDYIFAHGLRNTYDIAYNADGLLFGVDQADQSDHQEEMNWIREGYHYEFPWKIGANENLMQYPDYDPPSSDPLVTDVTMESTFYNDPDFPAPSSGIGYMAPIINNGPDQDLFRDTVDAVIKDASDIGRTLATFTPHSSPVALTFDVDNQLPGEYQGKAFTMMWSNTNDRKFVPFNQIGEDLLMIDLEKVGNNFEANVYRIAQGFNHPVDAAIIGNKMYVIEHSGDANLWEVTFEKSPETPLSLQPQNSGISIYPNSFSDEVTIDIQLERSGPASVTVFSMQGRKIKNLWEGSYQANQHLKLNWDGMDAAANNMKNGVYILEVTVEGVSEYARMLKLQ